MEEHLQAILRGSAAVTALVPPASINWRRHPQGRPWPGIVLRVVNDGDIQTPAGRVPMGRALVQCDCWGLDYIQAKAIGRAVRTLLTDRRDAVFDRVHLSGSRDASGMPGALPDDPAGVSLDFEIDHRPI